MDFLTVMVRDVVIIGVMASLCEMVLPDNDVKHPVSLVFGLYFMALLINPMVTLFTDTDLSSIDFSALAEAETLETVELYNEEMVYQEAANTLETEIEGKLTAVYSGCSVETDIKMTENGFESVLVTMGGVDSSRAVMAAEITDMLSRDYGISKDVLTVVWERG